MHRPWAQAASPTLLALLTSVVFALSLVVGTEIHPVVGLAVVCAPLLLVGALNPKWTALLTILAFVIFEEFPWGLGETVERSSRTAFYATSLGIPGLYPPDVLVFGSIFLLLARKMIARQPIRLPNDRIQWALCALAGLLVASAVSSLFAGNPLQPATVVETGTVYDVNEQGAALIALFQFKNFSFLFFSYFLGILYFESSKDVDRLLQVLFAAMLLIVAIGFLRLIVRPSVVTDVVPLFYHSPSTWIFALAIFFWLIQMLLGNTSRDQLVVRVLIAFALSIFILLSYRRTMWGAIIVAAVVLLPLLPRVARGRYVMVLLCALIGIGTIFAVVPPLLAAVTTRLSETSAADVSTIYRLSLFVWFRHHLHEIPLFGYGLRPLWDIAASLGYFRTNLENVHSLYFWALLRLGIVGFMGSIVVVLVVMSQVRGAILRSAGHPYLALCIVVALALVMLLFSGVFNPVYAEMRYIVLTGLALAFISRLPVTAKDARPL